MKTLLIANVFFLFVEIVLLANRPERVLVVPGYPEVEQIFIPVARVSEVVEETRGISDDELADLIAGFESYKPKVYLCPAGVKTIGYGFTEKKYLAMGFITKDKARSILVNELIPKYREIVRSTVNFPITPNQEAALISFTFNCGQGNLALLVKNRLNNGKVQETAKALLLYCKARVNGKVTVLKGLEKRRQKEKELFDA
jgi:lysozyme